MKKIKRLFNDMDKVLLFLTLIMFVFGLLNIVTASSKTAVLRYSMSLFDFFVRQLIALFVGLVAAIFIIRNKPHKKPVVIAMVYLVALGLLVYVKLYVQPHFGSQNWIRIPGFGTLQPSEFAKPVMIISLAILFELLNRQLHNPRLNHYSIIAKILFAGFLFPAIVFLEKDLGTSIILFIISGVMFLISPVLKEEKFKTITFLMGLGFAVILIFSMKSGGLLTESQKARFDFFDPCEDYYEGGYQICNGFIAINEGSLFGVGIGNSKQVSYIPESHTDSVFAIIAEEYGFLICSVIFIIYAVIIFRIFKLATRTSSISNRYMCYGIGLYIMLHVIVNLGGLFGVMPLTGVPLPFLSYGGSYTLSLCCSLAVIQSIHIETEREKIRV